MTKQHALDNIEIVLRDIPFFKNLETHEIKALALSCSLREFVDGQSIVNHRESGEFVYFITRGAVRSKIYTESGKEVSYQDLTVNDMFGELAVIDGLPRSTSVISLNRTEVLQLSKRSFLELIEKHPGLAIATMKKLAGLVRFLCERAYEFGVVGVKCRIHTELLRIAEKHLKPNDIEVVVPVLLTHQEFASRLATTREAVTREFSDLDKKGIIDRSNSKYLVIKDIEKLKALVEDG